MMLISSSRVELLDNHFQYAIGGRVLYAKVHETERAVEPTSRSRLN